jgi:protein PhnA
MTACDLCAAPDASLVSLAPGQDTARLCVVCAVAVTGDTAPGPRWRCLSDAIWSDQPGIQIAAWRVLSGLASEDWAADLLDSVYLDPEVLVRAMAGQADAASAVTHRDSNGVVLAAGDTVTLVKDLPVKGIIHGGQARHAGAWHSSGGRQCRSY